MHKFTKGDLVKVISDSTSSVNRAGDIGRVVWAGNVMISVEVEGRAKTFNSHVAAELELIEKESGH